MHRHLPRAAIAILAVTGLIGAAPARADWSAPETIALSGAGSGLSSLQFALDNGVAAAIWNENSSTARAAFRPFGGPFGSTQTLDTENLVYEPSVAVGPSGQAIAAWGFKNNTGPVQAIEYADLAAGSTTFGTPARLATSGQNHTQGQTGTSIDASGDAIVTWSGDDSCGNCGYTRIWSATRAVGSSAFSGNAAVSGNFEVGGLQSAFNAAGQGIAYAWGFAQSPIASVNGARRTANGSWSSSAGYCCAILNYEGPTSIAVDAAGNAYVTVDVAKWDNGMQNLQPGPNFIYVKNDGTFPQPRQNPDTGFFGTSDAPASDPQVAVDPAGNAVMTWIRTDAGPSLDLYTSYRPAGDTSTFGTPVLVASGLPDTGEPASNSRYRIATDSQGNTVLVFAQGCATNVCTLESEVRPPGPASVFGDPQTVATHVAGNAPVDLVADSSGNVLVGWRDTVSGMLLASLLEPANTAPPTISGNPNPGQTLTCSPGSWSWSPGSFTYSWLRDGVAITGASAQTYVPTAADVGHAFACRVTTSNTAGPASATSASVTVTGGPQQAGGGGGGGGGRIVTTVGKTIDGGEQLLTLTLPGACLTSPAQGSLDVQLSATRKFRSHHAHSRVVRVQYFIDGGVRIRRRRDARPNATFTRSPFVLPLAALGLKPGVHHVRVVIVLARTIMRRGHRHVQTTSKTLTATVTIC